MNKTVETINSHIYDLDRLLEIISIIKKYATSDDGYADQIDKLLEQAEDLRMSWICEREPLCDPEAIEQFTRTPL